MGDNFMLTDDEVDGVSNLQSWYRDSKRDSRIGLGTFSQHNGSW